MDDKNFNELVKQVFKELPEKFAQKIENVAVVVEDYPTQEQLARLRLSPHATLFGLYEGIAKPRRGRGYTMVPPDKITIFQGPIEDLCQTPERIKQQVKKTVLHEIAHHFGLSEMEVQQALKN